MTTRVLALYTSPRWEAESGMEFLRVVAAFAACGWQVRLAEAGAGCGVLSGDDLPDEGEAVLARLAEAGIVPRGFEGHEINEAVRASEVVLRCGARDRTGEPAVYEVGGEDPVAVDALASAGQVIRTS